jgi:uncharacterized membrane protein
VSGLWLGLGLALASALALDAGFLLQQHGASAAAVLTLRRPLASARALLSARGWLAGFAVGLCGWALYLAALARAPLSLVQATAAGGVALLVALDALARRRRPPRRELRGAACATAGLVALALSLRGAAAATTAPSPLGLVACAVAVIAAAAVLARGDAGAGGTAAGLLYGLGDVLTKALMLALPPRPALAALASAPLLGPVALAHLGGFLVLQRAFRRGGAVAAVAPLTAATTLLPIAAGAVVLREPLPTAAGGVTLRLVGFAAAAAGAVVLARTREQRTAVAA